MDPVNLYESWIKSPLKFVNNVILGDTPNIRVTKQQEDGLVALGKLVMAKIHAYKGTASDEEKELSKKMGISIQSGHGCHSFGTPILLANGFIKEIQNIKIHEQVMGDDGTPRNVLFLVNGRERMYRIRYHDGSYYDVNESHKLCLVATQTHGKQKRGNLSQVSVAEYLTWSDRKKRTNIGYKKSVEFPQSKKHLRIPPYILGLWLGDGDKNGSRFYNIDQEVIDEIKSFAKSWQMKYSSRIIKEHILTKGKFQRHGYNEFKESLRTYDLIGNKHIPFEYKTSSIKDRLELIAGLIDTDGDLDQRGLRVFSISQKSEKLARDIVFICQSVGLHATINKTIKSYSWRGVKKSGNYFIINITRNVEIIPTRIKRKQAAIIRNPQRNNLHFGFTIEPLGEGDYYGFELDKNHLYLLGDFTVTRNTGKDAFLAWAICWFLSCFPMCKIPCTAPTADQLDSILWSEITKWIRNSKKDTDGIPILSKWLTVQNRKIFFNEGGGKEWFAIARTTNPKSSSDEQAETLAGFHEDYMMICADEASGLPEAVFKPLEGGLTGKVNFMLMSFNPTRNRGFAIDSQQKNRRDWICLHWNSEDSEIVTREFIDRMTRKYGKDSNPYRIRVKGLPPLAEDDTLIPWDWIQDSIDRDIILADDDPVIFGVDVGAGGDHATILRRIGPQIQELKKHNTKDTMVLTGHISLELNEWESYQACCVDNIGIGLGVFNRLKELGHKKVFAVDVRGKPRNQDRFPKLRDELWWTLRERFENRSISIPNDDDLVGQLGVIKCYPESSGKMKIESKEDMRKRGIESPNDADALMMTMFVNDSAYRRPREWEDSYEEAYWKQKNQKQRGEHSWMGV